LFALIKQGLLYQMNFILSIPFFNFFKIFISETKNLKNPWRFWGIYTTLCSTLFFYAFFLLSFHPEIYRCFPRNSLNFPHFWPSDLSLLKFFKKS